MPNRHDDERTKPNLFGLFITIVLVKSIISGGKRERQMRHQQFHQASPPTRNSFEEGQTFKVPPHCKLVCEEPVTQEPNETLEKDSISDSLPEMVYGNTIAKPYTPHEFNSLWGVCENNSSHPS